MKELISVVIPVRNSAETIPALLDGIEQFFLLERHPYEIILVDDGSIDNSREKIKMHSQKNDSVHGFFFPKNYGQFAATNFGILKSKGQYIITIDDDLQYPVQEIKKLIDTLLAQNFLMVFGIPENKKQKKHLIFFYKTALFLFRILSFPEFYGKISLSSFRIIDRNLINEVIREKGSFNLYYVWEFPANSIGFTKVEHRNRLVGKSNYNLSQSIRTIYPYILFMVQRFSILPAIILSGLWILFFPVFFYPFAGFLLLFFASGFLLKKEKTKTVKISEN